MTTSTFDQTHGVHVTSAVVTARLRVTFTKSLAQQRPESSWVCSSRRDGQADEEEEEESRQWPGQFHGDGCRMLRSLGEKEAEGVRMSDGRECREQAVISNRAHGS